MSRPVLYHGVTIEDLRWAHNEVAGLTLDYPEALNIFERLDNELRVAEAMLAKDPISAARAMLAAHNATFHEKPTFDL